MATGQDPGTLLDRVAHVLVHDLHLRREDHRADIHGAHTGRTP